MRRLATFGMSDGLIAALAITLVASGEGRKVVLLALAGLFIAEGLGMAASQYLADPAVNLKDASVMGAATGGAIVAVACPWFVSTGNAAMLGSVVVGVCLAAIVAWLRPGRWGTWAQTYGVLVAVSTIAAAVGKLK